MAGRIRVSAKSERTIGGKTFDSKAEMRRYLDLREMEKAGMIKDLETQVPFILQESFRHPVYGAQRAIVYKADFCYYDFESRRNVVEDCKGMKTEVYRLKKKMLLAKYPEINFKEVQA